VPRSIAEVEIAFEPPEVRQHVVERPARIAVGRPLVKVGRRAADGEPRQPRRPADEPAATDLRRVVAVPRLGLIAPIRRLAEPPAVT
jgi:hypothetical protein